MRTHTSSNPDLLERESALEALLEAVARTREGAGRSVLIEAPAGVGKSRLLAGACALARDADLQVLEARGAVREREFAFGKMGVSSRAALALFAHEHDLIAAGVTGA